MRAISLWQPWATAIALGSKRVETRHWSTNYRGPLAIHAAKRKRVGELIHYHSCWNWVGAMGWSWGKEGENDIDNLPFGAIVATCELVDCRQTELFTLGEIMELKTREGYGDLYSWNENQMGDFSLSRYGWILENIKPLPEPIPYKGKQGFFNVDLSVAT